MGCTDDKIRHDAGAYTGTGSRIYYERIRRIGPDVEGLLQMSCSHPAVDGCATSQGKPGRITGHLQRNDTMAEQR